VTYDFPSKARSSGSARAEARRLFRSLERAEDLGDERTVRYLEGRLRRLYRARGWQPRWPRWEAA
jgi:hypothetical protein